MKIDIKYNLLLISLLFTFFCQAQTNCCYGGNAHFIGQTEDLQQKVKMKNALQAPLRIVHIGDSHTQPGIFSLPTT
jgi:hypothetical protein